MIEILKGKKALVTGASRGIGRAIALKLAQHGVEIALHYNDHKEAAESVLQEIEQGGGKGILMQADFNNPDEAVRVGDEAWEKLGQIDFLINNAGVSYKTHFFDASTKDLDFFLNINFKSTLLLTQNITRKMAASAVAGSVYTITSINGIQPGVGLSVYGATKGALETLMKGVALELAPHNIKVNTIVVGAIKTDMNAASRNNPALLQSINENIPLGRMGEPEEIAEVIVSLLHSATYMTGASIVIDGGWMLNQGYVNPKPYNPS